jgi:hypothetical protein
MTLGRSCVGTVIAKQHDGGSAVTRPTRTLAVATAIVVLGSIVAPISAEAQRRTAVRRPAARPSVVVRAYAYRPLFYDPWYPFGYRGYGTLGFGPRYGFYDGYGASGAIRIQAKPRETEVFVDGYYAGTVDDTGRLSHTGANGSSFLDRITREGYVASTGGENIAQGYRNPREVVAGWMSSSGHRANILNRNFREVGYGVSGTYWCVVFASPAGGNRLLAESAESFPSPLTMMG